MNPYQNILLGSGTRLQAGTPKGRTRTANGLLLRGVVMATYVTDDPGHPTAQDPHSPPLAVYCDVLVLTGLPGHRWLGLKNVLVSQERAGLQKGDIWKPRATSINISGKMDAIAYDYASLDGDNVLVGFLNDSFDQPIILRQLPHPSMDAGNDQSISGKRRKLTLADGDPDFRKHHGVWWGVDDSGDWVVDSRFGNDGSIDATGNEPAPATDGSKGNQTFNLPQDSAYTVELFDMSNPVAPVSIGSVIIDKSGVSIVLTKNNNAQLRVQYAGDTLLVNGQDAVAALKLGDGAVKAAIADHLQTLWLAFKTIFDAHVHPDPVTGNTGPSPTPAPGWDSSIASSKVNFPDG